MHRALIAAIVLCAGGSARAQLAPDIGYMFPSGGRAGETVEVTLGGYDWTPDMRLFVHDPRIRLEITSPLSEVIVPEPPYWFGKKARRAPFLLPREVKAELVIPADVPPGVVRWQAANANGASTSGRFVVGDSPEQLDSGVRHGVQRLQGLPVTVSGQIKHIEEVDQYRFTASKTGPLTVSLCAREIGSDLNAAIEVRDKSGRLLADDADTAGNDAAFTFPGEAGEEYTLSIYDVDFRGNRALVYRLTLIEGPQVVAAIPASGEAGQTHSVEFVGYGVATGAAKLESVTRDVSFPPGGGEFWYRLETPYGDAPAVELATSEDRQSLEADVNSKPLAIPAAVTGVLETPYGEDRYRLAGVKGDAWRIEVEGQRLGAPLDVALAVYDAEGNERARSDDMPGSTNAALEFTAPADGEYEIGVTDLSGRSGDRAAVYHLTVCRAMPGFTISAPEAASLPIGGTFALTVTATRRGGFNDPIAISISGLPEGVSLPAESAIPAKKTSLKLQLTAADNIAAKAMLVHVVGEARVGEQTITQASQPILLATTIPPPFAIDAEGQDDVTKWPRGTTFPAPVLIERQAGFHGEITLEMTSKQGRHRQGINGPELNVPDGVTRILYPVFLPEWLETTRTSRMVVNGVARVADPQGNPRYSLVRQKTRMGFLPTGALLKLSADEEVFQVEPGQVLRLPLTVSRAQELTEPATVELLLEGQTAGTFSAPRRVVKAADSAALTFPLSIAASAEAGREYELKIRATVLQNGGLPAVSETRIIVCVSAPAPPTE